MNGLDNRRDALAEERRQRVIETWNVLRQHSGPVHLSDLNLYQKVTVARYLRDLAKMGCVERPAYGWYVATPINPEWVEMPEEEPPQEPAFPYSAWLFSWAAMFKGWAL